METKQIRQNGIYFTDKSIIHKVIDPLFLDDLIFHLDKIEKLKDKKNQARCLKIFLFRLSNLYFLDPACGNGNFLIESYLSLRKLENKAIDLLYNGQYCFEDTFWVSKSQFYGFEIDKDFCDLCYQRFNELDDSSGQPNIYNVNALKVNWADFVNKDNLNFIIGNPPFVGYHLQSRTQKQEILNLFVDQNGKAYKDSGKIDYVSGWFFKAADFIQNSNIKVAFVSTKSIVQGAQASYIWYPIFSRFNIEFDFAYRPFSWVNLLNGKEANAVCVIIGFRQKKQLN